jgi:hypothetical protein
MLKHGRAGVPLEVMGLMLGDFVDEFTVRVIGEWAWTKGEERELTRCGWTDVFAMPQSGTGVSVEAVDPVFQTKMLDMLKQTGRCEPRLSCSTLQHPADGLAHSQARDGRWMVPFSPWIWLLAL